MAKLPYLRFRQSCFQQRGRHLVLRRRPLSWTEVSLIIYIHAISDGREPMLAGEFAHHLEQLILAMETPRGIVARVVRFFHLGGLDYFERDVLFFRKSCGILQVS